MNRPPRAKADPDRVINTFLYKSKLSFCVIGKGNTEYLLVLLVIGLILSLIALPLATPVFAANPPQRPNVVVIISDDAGFADFGFQGSKLFKTPNLDAIARSGALFKNAYASASVCTPSRAGLLTGVHPSRLGIDFNLPGDPGSRPSIHERGLPDSVYTVGDLFGQNGYVTAFFGKWHLGLADRFLPVNRGFSVFDGVLGGHSDYFRSIESKKAATGEAEGQPEKEYLTDQIADLASDFIDQVHEHSFLLVISFTAPHTPMQATPEDLTHFENLFTNPVRAKNAAMLHRLDLNVGRIREKLREYGLDENTLIVFTNDNNGSMGDNGASNGLLRGEKGTLFEGGIRAPLLISWTREIPAGVVISDVVSALDMIPTISAAAGFSLPTDYEFDGVNLLPRIKGETDHQERGNLYWRTNWASAIRQNDWKLIRTPQGKEFLFNIATDPYERSDLALNEIERVRSLRRELNIWENAQADSLWTASNFWREKVETKYSP